MADSKISGLAEDTTPSADDLLVTVNDPAGTPANKKVTVDNLDTFLSATTKTLTNKTLTSPKINENVALTATATELNHVDGVTSPIQTQIDGKQPLDSDLTTIAGLTATTDNFLVANASAWASRTPSQARTHMGLGALATLATVGTSQIDDAAVTLAKMANLAQDQFIGRTTASTGVPQTATITSAARTVLDDTTVDAMINTLGGATAEGTGAIVRKGSPTLTTPNLGTPSAAVLTNATGLPNAGLATGAGQPGGAWTSWTPSWTNVTTGNGTLSYAKYTQVGKTIHFRLKFILGTTSSVGGVITFSAPATINSDYAATDWINSVTMFYDANVTTPYQGNAYTPSTTTIALRALHTDGTRGNNEATSNTNPFTWTTSDVIYCSGTYEAA